MDRAPNRPIITLTTDFGLQDTYAGQLKGALLKGCPSATLVDLSHAIPPWDVVTAAITIRTSFAFFPVGTIHLIVVDPGVGSGRSILAASGSGHVFVAPDNGILSLLVADQKLERAYRVEHPDFLPPGASHTFHGRDIMALVVAGLAQGRPLADVGPAVVIRELVTAIVPATVPGTNCLYGQIQRIDHFGNIRTTIRGGRGGFDPARFAGLDIGGQRIDTLARTYGEARPGQLLTLFDSNGYLEVAANQASAAELLDCAPGDPVTVHLTSCPNNINES